MRLIDADALKSSDFQDFSNSDVFCAIDESPTIDAVQVVRGEWLQNKTAIGKTYSVCSECKTDIKFITDWGTLARLDMNGMNYCPNCGAKMEDTP